MALMGVTVPTAIAAGGWSPPEALPEDPYHRVSHVAAALDDDGNAAVAAGTLSVRAAGAAGWHDTGIVFGGWPAVAIDAAGNAVATWQAELWGVRAATIDIATSTVTTSPTFAPDDASSGRLNPVFAPAPVIPAGGGAVTAAFGRGLSDFSGVTDTWTPAPLYPGAPLGAGQPPAVGNAVGQQLFVYGERNVDALGIIANGGTVFGRTRWAPRGAWTAAVELARFPVGARSLSPGLNDAGAAIVAWAEYVEGGGEASVRAVTRAENALEWQQPVVLAAGFPSVQDVHVAAAAAPDGTFHVVWTELAEGEHRLRASMRRPGGTWTLPETLATGERFDPPSLAVTADGTALVAWSVDEGAASSVWVAERAPGGVWAALRMSATDRDGRVPALAVNGIGDAILAWTRCDDLGTVMSVCSGVGQVSFRDGDPPVAPVPVAPDAGPAPESPPASAATTSQPSLQPRPPALTDVRVSNARFHVPAARRGAARALPRSTAFRFTVSTKADVAIALARRVVGLRRAPGQPCRRPTRALRRARANPCTRYVGVGTLRRAGVDGRVTVAFAGRLSGRALTPGGYRATLTARNADGVSKPVAVYFTVVR